jgi:catechol 2,3-dioxygenase-like lactoylglutathione lyase family enzyme
MTTPGPTIRIARPTNNLATIKDFYTRTLGLRVIGSFEDHSGFDGVMLGHPEYSWHLEFTYQRGITVKCGPPTEDNLLVFYEPDKEKWEGMIGRIEEAGAARVKR